MPTDQETVFEFVQNKSTPALEPGPWGDAAGTGGYCLGLSMVWAYLRLKGKDFPYDPTTKKAPPMPPWTATMIFNYYTDMVATKAGQAASVRKGVEVAGLQVAWEKTDLPQCRQVNFGELLESKDGVYVVALNNRSGGGHAVAMARVDRKDAFRWFDPNYGHFAFPTAKRMQEAIGPTVNFTAFSMNLNHSTSLYRVKKMEVSIFDKIKIWLEK